MLPPHCHPTSPLLTTLSTSLSTCLPTPPALLTTTLGTLSILAWLCAQLPQIHKNYRLGSTAGLSIFFLVEWFLGDVSNLAGALLTGQAGWQVGIGAYYVAVDLCLVGQWGWYGWVDKRRRREIEEGRSGGAGGMREVGGDGSGQQDNHTTAGNGKTTTRPRIIFRTPTFDPKSSSSIASTPADEKLLASTPGSSSSSSVPRQPHRTITRSTSAFPLPSPSPRTILMLTTLLALATAHPTTPPPATTPHHPSTSFKTPLQNLGTTLSWLSALLYLLSRLPPTPPKLLPALHRGPLASPLPRRIHGEYTLLRRFTHESLRLGVLPAVWWGRMGGQ